jgi:coniferyl-aldehyde dehydrogenase
MSDATEASKRMNAVLQRQKAAHLRDGAPSVEKRIDWLDRAIKLLIGHEAAIVKALNDDFGNRAAAVSGITDVAGSIGP